MIFLAPGTAGKMAERILVERMGEHCRANHLCPLCPSYDRWAIPESWVHSPPNWEEELGVQLVSSIWNSSTWSPGANFPWGLVPLEESTSSWISPEIQEILEIKSVAAGGSQTLSFLLWRIIEGPACRLVKSNKLNFQSSELVLVFIKLPSACQDNVFFKLFYIAVELINNIV